jgi:hypothetical protein
MHVVWRGLMHAGPMHAANFVLGGQRLAVGRPVPTTTSARRTPHGAVRPLRRTRGTALKTQAAFGWGSPKPKDKPSQDPDESQQSVMPEAAGGPVEEVVGTQTPFPQQLSHFCRAVGA